MSRRDGRKGPSSYEVGYGKPPKAHQFKKGQSGNPKGRPRKVRRPKPPEVLRAEFLGILEQRIPVRENGVVRERPVFEVLIRQMIAKAAKGDFRSCKLLLETYFQYIEIDEEKRLELFEIALALEARDHPRPL